MINNITMQLYRLLKNNKMLILRADDISKQMAPDVQPEDVSDFLLFQAAIRKVEVGSILLKADIGSDTEKYDAMNMAISAMESNGIPHHQSDVIVKTIALALGWDKSKIVELEGGKGTTLKSVGEQLGSKIIDGKKIIQDKLTDKAIPMAGTVLDAGRGLIHGLGDSISDFGQKISSEKANIVSKPIVWTCPMCGNSDNSDRFCTRCGYDSKEKRTTAAVNTPASSTINYQPVDMAGNQTFSSQSRKNNLPVILAVSIGIVLILLVAFIGYNGFFANEGTDSSQTVSQQTTTFPNRQEVKTDLSLGGLELGMPIDEMYKMLGKEKQSKPAEYPNSTRYYYDDIWVVISDGKICGLASNTSLVKTKQGIGQGTNISNVLQTYGNGYKLSKFGGKQLYEYEYQSIDGKTGILRFAVNNGAETVDYISVRYAEQTTAQNDGILVAKENGEDIYVIPGESYKKMPYRFVVVKYVSPSNSVRKVTYRISEMGPDNWQYQEIRDGATPNRYGTEVYTSSTPTSIKKIVDWVRVNMG